MDLSCLLGCEQAVGDSVLCPAPPAVGRAALRAEGFILVSQSGPGDPRPRACWGGHQGPQNLFMGIIEQNVDSGLLSPCVGLSCSPRTVPWVCRHCSQQGLHVGSASRTEPHVTPLETSFPTSLVRHSFSSQVQKSGWCISGMQWTTPEPLCRGRVGAGPGVLAKVQNAKCNDLTSASVSHELSGIGKLPLCSGPQLSRLRSGNNNTSGKWTP